MNFDTEIINEFIGEASSLINDISDNLLELEQNPSNMELVNAIFRGFHTIKGAAGFMQFDHIVKLCHSEETLFDEIREGTICVNSNLCSASFAKLDQLKVMLHQLISKQTDNILAQVNNFSNQQEFTNKQTNTNQTNDKQINIDQTNIKQIDFDNKENSNCLVNTQKNQQNQQNHQAQQNNFSECLDAQINKQQINSNCQISNKQNSKLDLDLDSSDNLGNLGSSTNNLPINNVTTNDVGNKNLYTVNAVKLNSTAEQSAGAVTLNAQQNKTAQKNETAQQQEFTNNQANQVNQLNLAIKVDTSKLDKIVNLVGELVLLRNRMLHQSSNVDKNSKINDWLQSCVELNTLTCDLQNAVMQTRMQPLTALFNKFKRTVRDTALMLNKKVELILINADTELDKNLVEALENPLIHLLRNALDHGIETPEIRSKKGKSACGTITISAKQIGQQIIINLKDDGAGLDPAKIKAQAIKKGLISENTNLSTKQIYNLIFAPGFSTKESVSNISGRGVGMDVVKTNISKIGGSVEFSSEPNKGTSINITLPLTLAILPTLMVTTCEFVIAFTLSAIKEIVTFEPNCIKTVGSETLINVRGALIPLYFLGNLLQQTEQIINYKYVVITQTINGLVGFAVENLLGQEEVIIKPLNNLTIAERGFVGATITSFGEIALILDVTTMLAQQQGTNYVH